MPKLFILRKFAILVLAACALGSPSRADDLTQADQIAAVGSLSRAWADEQENRASALLELRAEILQTLDGLEKSKSPAEIDKLIDEGQLTLTRPTLGRAKITRVDGHRIVKIVPEKTRVSYFFLKKDEIEILSPHLRQLVARTHLESDPNGPVYDQNGQPVKSEWTGTLKTATGRDVVLVWLDEREQISGTNARLKAPPASPRWWADYFYAKYKNVSADEISFGIASGALQGVATAVVVALKAHLDHKGMDWSPVVASVAFGSIVNTFLSTYRNWAYIGPNKALNAMKASTVSIGFNVSMVEAHRGFLEGLHSMNFLTLDGVTFDSKMLGSAFVNNWTKNGWFKATALRTKARQNVGSLEFSIFGTNVNWNKANIENAIVYLIPFTLKQLDVFFFLNFPVMQTLGWPVGEYLGLWYAKRLAARPVGEDWLETAALRARESLEKLQEEWDSTFGTNMPSAARDWLIEQARSSWSAVEKTTTRGGVLIETVTDLIAQKARQSCADLFK